VCSGTVYVFKFMIQSDFYIFIVLRSSAYSTLLSIIFYLILVWKDSTNHEEQFTTDMIELSV
jgi:hypothetical protein